MRRVSRSVRANGRALLALTLAALACLTASGAANTLRPQKAPHFEASALRPAGGQLAPHSLLSSKPIAAVWAAAAAAQHDAPLPTRLNPPSPADNAPYVYVPYRCVPRFGPGRSFDICPLGDPRSARVVALIGDSHAWMWIPGLAHVARTLHFKLVPVTKPGCLLQNLHENRPGWPCRTWYSHALRIVGMLHPTATIVSFMTSNLAADQASWAAAALQGVLRVVPHPVLLADSPNYNVLSSRSTTPQVCLGTPGDNQGTCAGPETADMLAALAAIQAMVHRDGYPAVPTLQWFCADQVCPVVIDDTITSEDGSHITSQYSKLLSPLLADALRPLLDVLWRREGRL